MKNLKNVKSLQLVVSVLIMVVCWSCQNANEPFENTSIDQRRGDVNGTFADPNFVQISRIVFEQRIPMGYVPFDPSESFFPTSSNDCNCDERVRTICVSTMLALEQCEALLAIWQRKELLDRILLDDIMDIEQSKRLIDETCQFFPELCNDGFFDGLVGLSVLTPNADLFLDPENDAVQQYLENYPQSDFLFADQSFLYLQFNNREHDFLEGEEFVFEHSAEFPADLVESLGLPGSVIPEGFVAPIFHFEGDLFLDNQVVLIPIPLNYLN